MDDKFAFLKSVRFWKVVIIGLLESMMAFGVIDGVQVETFTRIIEAILGASIMIKTVDRFAEKSGAVDTGAVIATPTPGKVHVPPDQTGSK